MISKYCCNLTKVKIFGKPNHRIKMVNMENVKEMTIFYCCFDKQLHSMTRSKLLSLQYGYGYGYGYGSTTDIVEVLRDHPYIRGLTLQIKHLSEEQLRSIASLAYLNYLLLEVYETDPKN